MAKFSSLAVARESGRYFERGTALNRVLLEAPFLPRCSDDKTATKVRPREYAISYPYMQVNRPGMVSWLVFDLDHRNANVWEDAGLPAPNLIVRNRESGHSHLFYAIEPVCTSDRARAHPIDYMRAIYLEMAQLLRADLNYASGPVAKTPGHPWWATTELHASVFSLGKLADYLELPTISRRGSRVAFNHDPSSRHCQLFEVLRHYAYSIVDKAKAAGGYEQFVARLEAYSLNSMPRVLREAGGAQGDLPWSSIRSTARSVARWTWNRYSGCRRCNRGVMELDEGLSLLERQRLSAQRSTELRRKATESKVRAACRRLQADGKALALTAVAHLAGVSRQTVATYKHVLDEVVKAVAVATPDVASGAVVAVKFGAHQVPASRGRGQGVGVGLPSHEGFCYVQGAPEPPE